MFRKSILLVLFIFLRMLASAYSDTVTIPVFRQYFHDKINAEQLACDKADGKSDNLMRIGNNEEVNYRISDILFRKIDELQLWVETNEKIDKNNDKIRILGYIEQELRLFRQAWKKREIAPSEFPAVIDNFILMVKAQENGTPLTDFIKDKSYIVARINTMAFTDHPGFKEADKLVFFKYCALHPDIILSTIRPYVKESFADSLIVIACRYNPAQLYSYAQSINTPEGKLIHQNRNPLVITVAKLSQTENALMYFPFLDDIIHGKKTVEGIKKYVGDGESNFDSVGYYKLLVKTETEYFRRMSSPAKDTPIAMFGANGLREVLKDRAIRHFITPINNLHDESNLNVRMKSIDSLTAAEIYYMIVMGESDIYTSSFKHSFNRMLQRLGTNPRCDSLLLQVRFDYFKKFIKITANFNRLDTFLKKMPPTSSEALMKAFVANLDKSGSLEDATDVADSYSSINSKELQNRILEYVEENEINSINDNNEHGELVYSLLKNIFLSSDSSKKIDLTRIAGIPSIYELEKKGVADDSGRIIQQVFFYGDEDGKTFFQPFLQSFSPKDWKIVKKKEWVEIRSIKGNVWIFANLPLDYDANLDDSAQVHLIAYLEENEWFPTIVIHRGHSYWLPGTISRMPMNSKIVLLGSCGGYKNLQKILEGSPEAHIISTKEIGAGDINRPIHNALNQSLINKDKIVWRDMWNNLTQLFQQDKNKNIRESWESYVPPYKNLGAIFIKAYNKKMESM
ncbi:MAG: hypothetical protein RIR96_1147 [Bacteroidota bacterium]|jgi:hypothetical protein